jgi:transcriptional regulator with XRE-family HTH domain
MTLLETLIKLRLKHGVTQDELAQALNMTRQNYSHVESGKRRMRLDTAAEAFEELGFTLEAVESPVDDTFAKFSAPGLVKALYRRAISQKPIHIKNLRDCMDLNERQMLELNKIVRAFLDSPAMRAAMVAACEGMAKGNK